MSLIASVLVAAVVANATPSIPLDHLVDRAIEYAEPYEGYCNVHPENCIPQLPEYDV